MSETTPPRRSTLGRWLLLLAAVAVVVTFYALGWQRYFTWDELQARKDDLRHWTDANPVTAVVTFAVAYVLMAGLSLPGATVMTLAAGFLFGRWLGTGLVSFTSTTGATLAFLGSRYVFRDFAQARLGRTLDALNRGIDRDGAYYLFTLRLVPLFPFFLINLGMGLTRMRAWTFWWVSQLGMLPGTFLFVNAGTALQEVQSPGDLVSPWLIGSFALLGCVPLLLRLVLRRSRVVS